MGEKKKTTKEERRDFIKKSLTAVTGIAALPLLSATNALSAKTLTTKTRTLRVTPQTKVSQLSYLKGSLAVRRNPNLRVADLNKLTEIAIGSLGRNKYTSTYQRYRTAKEFMGIRSSELQDLGLRGLEELLEMQKLADSGCGSCASCCCCCCPCCCCS